jgi:hypothetical protein
MAMGFDRNLAELFAAGRPVTFDRRLGTNSKEVGRRIRQIPFSAISGKTTIMDIVKSEAADLRCISVYGFVERPECGAAVSAE